MGRLKNIFVAAICTISLLFPLVNPCSATQMTGVVTDQLNSFQTGNTNPVSVLQLKDPEELTDTGVTTFVSGMIKIPINNWYDWAQNQVKKDGFTVVKGVLNFVEAPDVDMSYAYIEEEMPQDYLDFYRYLNNNGIKIRYCLDFWDMQHRLDGGTISKGRLSSEAEVQRYLDYVKMVVTSLKGLGVSYELWNEPDVSYDDYQYQYIEPEDYIKVAKRAIPLIRELDPGATIALPGTASYYNLNTQAYTKTILNSDVVQLADAITLHPIYDVSPETLPDYYYGYDNMWTGIKATAEKNGFHGQYRADEITYSSTDFPKFRMPELGDYEPYEPQVAAKYYGRMMAINRGLDILVGTGGTNSYERVYEGRMIRNMAYLLEGLDAVGLPVNVESKLEKVRYYTFEDAQGNLYLAIWNDNTAAVNCEGIECNISIPNTSSDFVTAMDPLNSLQQNLIASNKAGSLVLEKVILKDYPLIIKVQR